MGISSLTEFDNQLFIYLIIMFRLVVVCALAAIAAADHPAPAYVPAPYHAPAPAYHKPEVYDESPKPYAFQYGVLDDYSGNNFNAQETQSGHVVSGSYQIHLPDGRVQTVTYTADENGYHADVSYEGTAHYPEDKPYHPAPAYKPVPHPVYKPAPY